MRPLNDRHKKSNTDGVGSDRLLEVSTPLAADYTPVLDFVSIWK